MQSDLEEFFVGRLLAGALLAGVLPGVLHILEEHFRVVLQGHRDADVRLLLHLEAQCRDLEMCTMQPRGNCLPRP